MVSIWRENMLGYLSADIICSEKQTVFRERSSGKTVSFEEQIMSKDTYSNIFSHIVSILRENMHGYLSADNICSEKRTVFQERSSRKTVSIKEQIMPKDKYPCIYSREMETIVFFILQIFFATRAVLKIGVYSRMFPSFNRGIFGNVMRLD